MEEDRHAESKKRKNNVHIALYTILHGIVQSLLGQHQTPKETTQGEESGTTHTRTHSPATPVTTETTTNDKNKTTMTTTTRQQLQQE